MGWSRLMGGGIRKFLVDDSGATAIEYALIATFVFMVIISSLKVVGQKLSPVFVNVANNL
jgi:pilus assembly protein Flp/PilA